MLLAAVVVSVSNASETGEKTGYVQGLKNGVSFVWNTTKNAGQASYDVIVNDVVKKSVASWQNGALTAVSAVAAYSAVNAITSKYTPKYVRSNRVAKAAATIGAVYATLKYFGTK